MPAGVGVQAESFLAAVVAIAVEVPAFDGQESVHCVMHPSESDAAIQRTETATVEGG